MPQARQSELEPSSVVLLAGRGGDGRVTRRSDLDQFRGGAHVSWRLKHSWRNWSTPSGALDKTNLRDTANREWKNSCPFAGFVSNLHAEQRLHTRQDQFRRGARLAL